MSFRHTQRFVLISLILCFSFPGCNQQASSGPGGSTAQSEWPILELDEISFTEPELKETTRAFDDHFDSIAGDDWSIQQYLRRYSLVRYHAIWRTSKIDGRRYEKSALPYRSMSILLRGPRAAEGVEEVDSLIVSGTFVPAEGWAAMVSYNVKPVGNGHAVFVSLVEPIKNQVQFSDTNFRLTNPSAEAKVREKNEIEYRYKATSPNTWQGDAKGWQARHSAKFLNLFTSPENMRDSVLADLAERKKSARDRIPRLEKVWAIDFSNVRSDNPPREMLVERSPPSEATKTELLEPSDVSTQCDGEIHQRRLSRDFRGDHEGNAAGEDGHVAAGSV